MTDPYTSPQEQLDDALGAMRYWDRRADTFVTAAANMNRVANSLRAEVDSLRNLFLPIRQLHTTATWEGNAATQSRQRLDTNEGRFESAIQMINGLIGQLSGEAITASRQAQSARSEQERHRRAAATARSEVDALDHSFS